ncbi:MAG TPA: hypothetical protein VJH37_01110 [Candidatus Nanoarchaeia archaeon]|nr:hypothetical protein [Candidatus Nanoarchaeia archaeon]
MPSQTIPTQPNSPNPLALLIKVAKEKHIEKKWENQPLYLIKILPNTSKGDLGEDFIEAYANVLGFVVEEKKNRKGDYDKKINGKKFEIKFATEDKSGSFQFNHIRMDFKYDYLICIGCAPNDIFFEIYPKEDVVMGRAGTMVSMGKGHNADFKLTKKKSILLPIRDFKDKMTSILR